MIRYLIPFFTASAFLTWADPPTIELDLGEVNLGPLGFVIKSTDFEAQPERRIVVTLTAKGEILDVRGRYDDGEKIEEWSLYYHKGTPSLVQMKKWNKLSNEGEDWGEALVNVETYVAKAGRSRDASKEVVKRVSDLKNFAKAKQAELASE